MKLAERWNVDSLLAEAERQAGLSDWGEPAFRDGLAAFVQSINDESLVLGATQEGLAMEYDEVLRILVNRLRIVGDRKRFPAIAQERIVRPVFVVGPPRTGTTHMHHLLSLDPANRCPLLWEMLQPSPPPERATWSDDPRIRAVAEMLNNTGLSNDNFAAMHEFSAVNPEECLYIFEYAFRSLNQTAKVLKPLFMAWLRSADITPAFTFHRMFLQYLQWRCPGDRWVLKAPQDILCLRELFATYPDATVVLTHRHPAQSLASVISITNTLHSIYHRKLNQGINVAKWLDIFDAGLEKMMEVSRDPFLADRFVHVSFDRLNRDPAACVEQIYRHLGAEFTPALRQGIDSHMAENPRHKHGKHRYELAGFGLSEALVQERFGDYIDFLAELP